MGNNVSALGAQATQAQSNMLSVHDTPTITDSDYVRYAHYEARSAGDMARFLKAVYKNRLLADRVKSVKFSLPYDGILESGVVELIGVNVQNPLADVDPQSDEIEGETEKPRTVFEAAAEIIECNLIMFGKLENIPTKDITELYTYLFSICRNVERVQIPKKWEKDFLLAGRFPKVDLQYIKFSEDDGGLIFGELVDAGERAVGEEMQGVE